MSRNKSSLSKEKSNNDVDYYTVLTCNAFVVFFTAHMQNAHVTTFDPESVGNVSLLLELQCGSIPCIVHRLLHSVLNRNSIQQQHVKEKKKIENREDD